MVQMQVEAHFISDVLKGNDSTEMRISLIRYIDDEMPADDEWGMHTNGVLAFRLVKDILGEALVDGNQGRFTACFVIVLMWRGISIAGEVEFHAISYYLLSKLCFMKRMTFLDCRSKFREIFRCWQAPKLSSEQEELCYHYWITASGTIWSLKLLPLQNPNSRRQICMRPLSG